MYGAGDVRVETVADPVIQEPTDAIVRNVAVRIRVCVRIKYSSLTAHEEA